MGSLLAIQWTNVIHNVWKKGVDIHTRNVSSSSSWNEYASAWT
jgi:hypothetical protein